MLSSLALPHRVSASNIQLWHAPSRLPKHVSRRKRWLTYLKSCITSSSFVIGQLPSEQLRPQTWVPFLLERARMVYRGKPSEGCFDCRKRKVRCDLQKPACARCTRARRTCSGYRDPLDLLFHDQTKEVEGKMLASVGPSSSSSHQFLRATAVVRAAPSDGQNPSVASALSRSSLGSGQAGPRPKERIDDKGKEKDVRSSRAQPRHTPKQGSANSAKASGASLPVIPWDASGGGASSLAAEKVPWAGPSAPPVQSLYFDVNLCGETFFYNNYTMWHEGSTNPALSYFPAVFACPGDQCFRAATSAIGLASMASIQNSASLWVEAHKQYGKSLRLTNEIIRDPLRFKTDEALTSVMLLSQFELVSYKPPSSFEAWCYHLKGASTLLHYRLKETVKGEIAHQTMGQLRLQLVLQCYTRRVKPPQLLRLVNAAYRRFDMNIESRLHSEYIDLMTDASDICFSDPDEPSLDHINWKINALCEIIPRFTDWADKMYQISPYYQVTPEDTHLWRPPPASMQHLVYTSSYHVYADNWSCNKLQGSRSCRLLLVDTLCDALEKKLDLLRSYPASPRTDSAELTRIEELFQKHRAVALEMGNELCDGTPFQLGLINPATGTFFANPCPIAICGYIAMWPIFVGAALATPTLDPSRARWGIATLEYIQKSMGINQALMLADVLRSGLRKPWDSSIPPASPARK